MSSLFQILPAKAMLVLFTILLFSCKENSNDIFPETEKTYCETYPSLCDKYYNEVAFLMTHNAFSYAGQYLAPNQTHPISRQLIDGVRGLMIDVYDGPTEALVYHGTPIAGQQKLVDVLKPIKVFLDNNPNEIISIIFQNGGSNEQLEAGIIASGLDQYAYVHDGTWELMKDMVTANTRLVMFVEANSSPSTRQPWLHYAWGTVFDTPYSFKSISEFNCDINRGGGGSRDIYLVNHWLGNALGLPDINLARNANKKEVIIQRLQDCSSATGQFVNFLGIDFYHVGAAQAIVDSINGM
jgi:hypothetical protein